MPSIVCDKKMIDKTCKTKFANFQIRGQMFPQKENNYDDYCYPIEPLNGAMWYYRQKLINAVQSKDLSRIIMLKRVKSKLDLFDDYKLDDSTRKV